MKPNGSWLYVFSSNAQKTYLVDALRGLMIPRGMVIHVRYEEKYVHPTILEGLPHSGHATENLYRDSRVLMSYLLQERRPNEEDEVGNPWWPVEVFPVRAGTVLDTYEEGGVVHTYFSVDEYPSYEENLVDLRRICMQALHPTGINRKFYASIGQALSPSMLSGESDALAFNRIIKSLEPNHFCSVERTSAGTTELASYDPVFLQILGIKRLKHRDWLGEVVDSPVHLEPLHERAYERAYRLTSADPHIISIGFYQPRWSTIPDRGCTIEIKVPGSLFSTSPPEELPISSRYDLQEASFIAARGEMGWVSQLRLRVNCESIEKPAGSKNPKREILFADWTCWLKLPRPGWAIVLDVLGVAATVGVGVLGVLAGQRLQTIPLWVVLAILLASLIILILRRFFLAR